MKSSSFESRDLIAPLVVFFAQILLLFPARTAYLTFQDEGSLVTGASRILDGQLPYGDFVARFMPGTYGALSLGFAVAGEQIWVSRWYFLISLACLATTIWYFSRRLLSQKMAVIPVLMFLSVGGHFWPMASYHWDASIFALLAMMAAVTDSENWSEVRRRLFLSGVFCGLTVLVSQPRGVAVCLAVGLVTLLDAPRLKRLGWLIAGAALPGALFTTWLLAFGIFSDFWSQAVVYNVSVYSVTQQFPFDWGLSLQHLRGLVSGLGQLGAVPFDSWLHWLWRALSYALVDLTKYTLFVPIVLMGFLSLRKGNGIKVTSEQRLVLLVILFLLISAFTIWSRATRYHFNFHTPAFYPLVVYLICQLKIRFPRVSFGLLTVLVLAFSLHGIDNYLGWYKYRYPIRFQRGILYAEDPQFAVLNQELSQWLTAEYDEKPLVGVPDLALITWLSGAENPTSYDVLAPLFYKHQDFERARTELEHAAPAGILFRSLANSLQDYPNVNPADYQRIEEQEIGYLVKDATLIHSVGPYVIFQLPK